MVNSVTNVPHVLIAGGSGLIGTLLTQTLLKEGYKVSYLSRKTGNKNGIKYFLGDPAKNYLDPEALNGVTHIISLAGEPIAAKKWTNEFKQKIISSRLNASATILHALKNIPNTVSTLITASAIGIYGDRNDEVLTEDSVPGIGFLPHTVSLWESSYIESPVRTVILRFGIVLSKNGGALPEMIFPFKFFMAPILGSGKQYMSWIHIDDLCGIVLHSIKNQNSIGVYNVVAPNPVTNYQFISALKTLFNKPVFTFKVPAFILQLALGEKKAIVLNSAKVAADKISNAGYIFHFNEILPALKNIYGK